MKTDLIKSDFYHVDMSDMNAGKYPRTNFHLKNHKRNNLGNKLYKT
jgi:hypothetical protein